MKKGLSLLLALVLVGATFVGCSNKKNQETKTVNIGYFPNITHAQALVGIKRGDFASNLKGKEVNFKQFNAGSAELEALLAEQIDIGYIGPIPAINAYVKSKGDIVIIGGATNYGAVLVTREDIKLNSIKDLKGKKIAVPQFGNTQDLVLRGLLKDNGVDDVTIVQGENPEIKNLLDKKAIDGAFVPEPWGSRLEIESKANLLLDYDKVFDGAYPVGLIVARKDFIEKNPETVKQFLKTNEDITKFINENRNDAIKVVNDEINDLTKKALPQNVIENSFKRIEFTTDVNKDATIKMADILVQTKYLKEQPNLNNLFNLK